MSSAYALVFIRNHVFLTVVQAKNACDAHCPGDTFFHAIVLCLKRGYSVIIRLRMSLLYPIATFAIEGSYANVSSLYPGPFPVQQVSGRRTYYILRKRLWDPPQQLRAFQ